MGHRFKCSKCDLWHEGLPDVGYDRPSFASEIPEEEKARRVFLTSDLCIVDNEYFFIRCILLVPTKSISDEFGWGIWSSLSKTNFACYKEHYDEDMSDWQQMFGYLSNGLPEYPDTLNLKLSVQTWAKGDRPLVSPEPTDHPLAVAQREGMPLDRALKIAEQFIH